MASVACPSVVRAASAWPCFAACGTALLFENTTLWEGRASGRSCGGDGRAWAAGRGGRAAAFPFFCPSRRSEAVGDSGSKASRGLKAIRIRLRPNSPIKPHRSSSESRGVDVFTVWGVGWQGRVCLTNRPGEPPSFMTGITERTSESPRNSELAFERTQPSSTLCRRRAFGSATGRRRICDEWRNGGASWGGLLTACR